MSELPPEHIVDCVEVVQDDNDQWRARGLSSNGEIIWTTEQYVDRDHAMSIARDTGRPIKGEEPVAKASVVTPYPEYILVVFVKHTHLLERRPFLGIGEERHEAIEDAVAAARAYWDQDESNMGIVPDGVIDVWALATDEDAIQ